MSLAYHRHARRGITLVELLVSISIIGMLMALLLPGVQASRETGRRTECLNRVRQIATAMLLHEAAQGRLPTGGWGGEWVADPNRGTGRDQPGGWVWCVLPYLERSDLARVGRDQPSAQKSASVATLQGTSLAIFNCPSRRVAQAYPISNPICRTPLGSAPVDMVARSDYAANSGSQNRCDLGFFAPRTLAQGDDPLFPWPDVSDHNGICYLRSEIRPAQIVDGTAYTYLVGEKCVQADQYETGADLGDDWSMYTGYQNDICRSAGFLPRSDELGATPSAFGSAHTAGWHVAMCDGSARLMRFDLHYAVHRKLGNRADQGVIDDPDLSE